MRFLLSFFFLALVVSGCSSQVSSQPKPNILFIAVDDLRPELGCYGSPIAITPNIDELAQNGLLFERAYCQQAICSPSRASLMTGTRPETSKIIENYTYFRDLHPDIITLPQHFRANGYETVYTGKVYHGKFTDEELSWSREPAYDKVQHDPPQLPGGYALRSNQEIFKQAQTEIRRKYGTVQHYALGRGPAYEKADVPDHTYVDGFNTELAIATVKELVQAGDKPFFLGYGFRLPHLDWTAPKKYWDLYDPREIELSTQPDAPEDGAAMGLHASFELRVRHGIPKSGEIDSALATTLKHAYLASVSYVDAQIGKMMAALEDAGVLDNTVIILWSDHGWHLGDMGVWGKATNYEIATRVPLILSSPHMPEENRGRSTQALVELVDMYPTLCELAGLEAPPHLEGQSFAPLLQNPDRAWKEAVFSQYPCPALREWAANPLTAGMRETYFGPLIEEVESRIMEQQGAQWNRELFEDRLMGYSMRTDQYRLVVWKEWQNPDAEPLYLELYDHQADPEERKNIAQAQPGQVKRLLLQLDEGWQGNQAELK